MNRQANESNPNQSEPIVSSKVTQDSSSLIDRQGALNRLGGDEELFVEFAHIFLEDAPPLIKELKNTLAERDAKSVERVSHALKGLTSNFGAKPCVDLLVAIEQAARRGDLSELSDEFERLLPLCDQLQEDLKKIAK